MTNRLSKASSPYLIQHADNPVDWYEWGEEALTKAKKENKPLIISIGYAACHWCHVMAHESFMDEAVAAYMNEHFVCIKIDREERPDIDHIYMEAAQLLSGSGGWPLNAFALPDGKPFYAGTYFPIQNWMNLLQQISNVYTNHYDKVEEQASLLTQGIQSNELVEIDHNTDASFNKDLYKTFFPKWQGTIDYELGGFMRAPKFPLPISWEFLLQYHYLTKDNISLQSVKITLDEIAKGGIYDQAGGGFARYSTDKYWKVPHFEKMLYDNGQLVSLYAHAYQLTQQAEYAEIINQTLSFVERELMSHEGGFYSALDADSEGEEGKFYVWTKKEIEEALQQDPAIAPLIEAYYNITAEGNWEHGNNILFSTIAKPVFAAQHNLTLEAFNSILFTANDRLLQCRNKRVRPSTDNKILTSWNALMLSGYINAYKALGKETHLSTALTNARFLEKKMLKEDGSLYRNYKDGKASIHAFLDDYALLAQAYTLLYEVTFDAHWLHVSRQLIDYTLQHFYDDATGMFFYTSNQSESLIARKHEIVDNVIPSSNSILANVLFNLGLLFNEELYRIKALNMLRQVENKITTGGPYYANWAILLGMATYQTYEVAITGNHAIEKSRAMQKSYLPTAIFMGGTSNNESPLLQHKIIANKTPIYVCKSHTCSLPVYTEEEALKLIGE